MTVDPAIKSCLKNLIIRTWKIKSILHHQLQVSLRLLKYNKILHDTRSWAQFKCDSRHCSSSHFNRDRVSQSELEELKFQLRFHVNETRVQKQHRRKIQEENWANSQVRSILLFCFLIWIRDQSLSSCSKLNEINFFYRGLDFCFLFACCYLFKLSEIFSR